MAAGHKHPKYMLIFLWLAILTVVEVAVAMLPSRVPELGNAVAITIVVLCGLAFVKAGLVGAYFMHLKFESKAFILIVTAPIILMIFLVCMLLPDVGFSR